MTRFLALTPMLQSGDIQRTIDWYTTVLGFRCVAKETTGAGWNATARR